MINNNKKIVIISYYSLCWTVVCCIWRGSFLSYEQKNECAYLKEEFVFSIKLKKKNVKNLEFLPNARTAKTLKIKLQLCSSKTPTRLPPIFKWDNSIIFSFFRIRCTVFTCKSSNTAKHENKTCCHRPNVCRIKIYGNRTHYGCTQTAADKYYIRYDNWIEIGKKI